MKNVPDKEFPTAIEIKKKAYLRIVIPVIVLLTVLCILFVLYISGSFTTDAGRINDSFVDSDTQVTGNKLEETATEDSQNVMLDETKDSEIAPTAELEPGEESEPDPTVEPIREIETMPDNITEAPTEHTHIYKDTVIAPNCSSKGYTLHECGCGHSYTDNEQEKLPHNYTDQIISPTVDSQGYTLHICSVCNYQFKDNYTDLITLPTEPSAEEKQPPATEPEAEEEHPEEDYGFCPACGRRLWTSWYPSGCFTYLTDTVCSCGQLVYAMQCHHH